MFLYLSDVGPEGGPLAVVPGSTKLPLGPLETLRQSFKSSMTLDSGSCSSGFAGYVGHNSYNRLAADWLPTGYHGMEAWVPLHTIRVKQKYISGTLRCSGWGGVDMDSFFSCSTSSGSAAAAIVRCTRGAGRVR